MGEISLTDYLISLWRRKTLACAIVVVVTGGAVAYSYRLPKIYESKAIIMPSASQKAVPLSSFNGLLSSLPSWARDSGRGADSSRFSLFLTSLQFQGNVIESLGLLERLAPAGGEEVKPEQRMRAAALRLGSMVHVGTDRIYPDKLEIGVRSSDPEFATAVARQYLVELQNFIFSNALTDAKRYRFHLEEQMARLKEEILEMGKTLAVFYGKNPGTERSAHINVPIAVRAGGGIRNFKNFEEFKEHFDILQRGEGAASTENQAQYVKDVPHQIYLDYLQTQQGILQSNYAALSQAHQLAKIDEAKQEPSFDILEEPMVPLYKIFPNRRKIASGAFVISVFLALGTIFYLDFGRKTRRVRSVEWAKQDSKVEAA